MSAGQQPISNNLKLSVPFRTNKNVCLSWDAGYDKDNLTDYPYSLWYEQIGPGRADHPTPPIQVPLPNIFYTQCSLDLPGGYRNVLFVPGNEYRFVLKAQPREAGSTAINGITEVQIPERACHDNIQDILDSANFLQELCLFMDPKPQLRKVVAGKFGISTEVYDHVEFYKNPETHPVTSQLLQHIVNNRDNGNNDKLKVCNLLQVVKGHGTPKILKVLFNWHTGRNGGRGQCAVCTRDLFGI
ncbi:uncharacterized protein [Amphiura filiformis]|uniref:uncharacterized protein n=1 Tax=Amphiura filiformis TaxID=82378 RepID=UPI003B21D987